MAVTTKNTEKDKALEAALSQIQKQFGKGSIMKLGDDSQMNIAAISTGSISLDIATGIGGVPKGRIIEIYARNLGVDVDELLVSQPDTGEQALEICDMLARSGALDVIVIDSVAALVPRAEIEGDMGDSHVGLHARLMSQALRKITGTVNKTNTCVIFINQLREKVGIMFGNPEVTTGGRALKFYATMRMDVRRIESLKVGDSVVGNRTRVKIVKNKVAPPFKQAEFDIMYGKGISREGDVLDCAVSAKIIEKAGSWYSFEGERIGQGRENVKEYLAQHPEVMEKVEKLLLDSLKPKEDKPEEKQGDITQKEIDEIMDIFVDEDGVIFEK